MKSLVDKYLSSSFLRAPDDGGGSGGGGGDNGNNGSGGQGSGGGGNQGGQNQNGGGNGGSGQWYASHGFDADTQAWIEERKFQNLGETVKAGREGSKLARDRNVMPKPDPKNVGAWEGFAELGWNPDAEKYAIEKPQMEEGETFDEGAFTAFKQAAHKAKVPAFQAQALFNAMQQLERQQMKDAKTRGADERRKLDTQLRQEWGADYEANTERAKRAFAHVGKGKFSPDEIASAIGSPRTAAMFAEIGQMLGEDVLAGAGGNGGGFNKDTVASLSAELNRLNSDPEFKKARDNPQHPRHKDVVAQREGLMRRKAEIEVRSNGNRR